MDLLFFAAVALLATVGLIFYVREARRGNVSIALPRDSAGTPMPKPESTPALPETAGSTISPARTPDPAIEATPPHIVPVQVTVEPSAPLAAERDPFDDFMDALATELDGTWFNSKVVGVSYPNDDGSSRQEAIQTLSPRDILGLVLQPTPKFPAAVAVMSPHGEQIGYLDSRLGGEVFRSVTAGREVWAAVVRRTGKGSAPHYGVIIAVMRWPAPAKEIG